MIGITGKRSAITKHFVANIPEAEIVYGTTETLPHDLDSYFLCAGALAGKDALSLSDEEALEIFRVNYLDVVRFCEAVFNENPRAKICVMGSESGFKGSFDTVYGGTKAALHLYVQSKKLLHPEQHLVCVAPTVIEDTGMTQRRKDLDATLERGKTQKLGRWLKADEVARVARMALTEVSLCNSVIRMTGGN
jgi:NAD(P)-dependent dehydrogenase (short-subunit alcohol dehydrogenase family)